MLRSRKYSRIICRKEPEIEVKLDKIMMNIKAEFFIWAVSVLFDMIAFLHLLYFAFSEKVSAKSTARSFFNSTQVPKQSDFLLIHSISYFRFVWEIVNILQHSPC